MTRNRASAKAAGTRFESQVVAYLAEHYDDVIERRTKTGGKDRGDVSGWRFAGLVMPSRWLLPGEHADDDSGVTEDDVELPEDEDEGNAHGVQPTTMSAEERLRQGRRAHGSMLQRKLRVAVLAQLGAQAD